MKAKSTESAKRLSEVLPPRKPRKPVKRLEDVLMPGKFIGMVDRLVNSLYRPIIRGAFQRAFDRKSGPNAGYVTEADVFDSAKAVLGTAIPYVPEELMSGEARHVRRKSA